MKHPIQDGPSSLLKYIILFFFLHIFCARPTTPKPTIHLFGLRVSKVEALRERFSPQFPLFTVSNGAMDAFIAFKWTPWNRTWIVWTYWGKKGRWWLWLALFALIHLPMRNRLGPRRKRSFVFVCSSYLFIYFCFFSSVHRAFASDLLMFRFFSFLSLHFTQSTVHFVPKT